MTLEAIAATWPRPLSIGVIALYALGCLLIIGLLKLLDVMLTCREQRRKRDESHEDYDAI
jgi:hypothetical protein